MARIERFEILATDFPFRKPFKHAAAERRSSYSLLVRCDTDTGPPGYGECLPREYVTGETREGAFELLKERILPRLVGREFGSLDEVTEYLGCCDGKAPAEWVEPDVPQTAAWCVVDLALLDAFGRAFGEPVRLEGDVTWPPAVRYSVVISSEASLKTLLAIRFAGVKQVKLKVEAEGDLAAAQRARRWLGRRCDIRVDANMAWDADEALAAMGRLSGVGIHSYEQPIPADDIEGLARLVRESGQDVMADESLGDRDSLDRLIEMKACTAVNVRISKCGGLLAARARCREALEAGLKVQVGCQVGESSLLSAAHLVLVTAVRRVTYAEGCFGHLLLREDPAEPVLQVFAAPIRPASRLPTGAVISRRSRTIRRTATMGVARIMPTIPQIMPKKMSPSSTTTGCRSSDSPMTFGSRRLPTVNWMPPGMAMASTFATGPIVGLRRISGTGSSVEMIDPMLGMKFRRNASTPKTRASSTPSSHSVTPTSVPVVADTSALVST
jgi:muconate cycloisomerase